MDAGLKLSLVKYKPGTYIIVEGDTKIEFFYIIKSGQVRIRKEVDIVESEKILNPGDFFGVISVMSNHSQIETAQALTDVDLIAVHRSQFSMLIIKNNPVAMKIIREFSQRMRFLDESLARLALKEVEMTDDLSHLFDVAEYYAKTNEFQLANHAYSMYVKYCPFGEKVALARHRMTKIAPYIGEKKPVESGPMLRTYPENTMIFSESEPGDEMYIIQSGSVKITKIINDKEVLLALLHSKDIFGEMALLENKPRSASAIAHKNTVLMVVNRSNFNNMVQTRPELITRLTELLSNRIWVIYKQLENALMKSPVGKLYDTLLIELEKARVPIEERKAYSFDFGIEELVNMAALSKVDSTRAVRELLDNKIFRIIDNKITVNDISEIDKQVKYFKKMQKIEAARQKSTAKN
ncbi:MAG: cyclic nucleotide-binding domain-containing protein [Spirochaetales bacterium]|nr:cyclic nucleotide-binding domain-containing protein [Spirochaetales bacterium]